MSLQSVVDHTLQSVRGVAGHTPDAAKKEISRSYKPDSVSRKAREGQTSSIHLSIPPEGWDPRQGEVRQTRNLGAGHLIPYFVLHRGGFTVPPRLPLGR